MSDGYAEEGTKTMYAVSR